MNPAVAAARDPGSLADSTGAEPVPISMSDYPLEPGDVWRYRTEETISVEDGLESRSGILEVRVLARHRHGPLNVVALARRRSGPEPGEDLTFVVHADSAAWFISDPRRMRAVFAGDRSALDPERADLRFPLAGGRKWGVLGKTGRPDSRYMTVVGRPDSIFVPAGASLATPVQFNTLPDQSTSWYRAGIGLVQFAYRHNGNRTTETWRLIEFRHDPVDTAAIGRAIDGAFDRLLAQPGFWSRRTSAVWDPALRALLGPLTGGDVAGLEEGVRRFSIRGEGSILTVEQLSNVPSWACLVRWRTDQRTLHVYAREWEPISGGVLGADAAPPLFLSTASGSAVGRVLQKARLDFLRAREFLAGGDAAAAGATADLAMGSAAAVLSSILDGEAGNPTQPGMKQLLREAVGNNFLTTHYGNRILIDDGYIRYRLERRGNLVGVWASIFGDGNTQYGPAPRVRLLNGSLAWSPWVAARSMEPRRIIELDWSSETREPDLLVWSSGLPPRLLPSITLFRLTADGEARAVWKRDLQEGQATLIADRTRLELTYTLPDSLNGVFKTLWREYYGPPVSGSESPVPIQREILNPWMATAARVVNAFRFGSPGMAAPVVRGADVLDRISLSWISDPQVSIRSVSTDPETIDELSGDRVASVTLRRGPRRPPENPGPEGLTLRLIPGANGSWVVVDLVPLHSRDFSGQ